MAISSEIKEELARKLKFFPAPSASELNRQVKDFIRDSHGYGNKVTTEKVLNYIRHNYTNWPVLQSRMQNWKVWSMKEHHEIRDYVDDLIWKQYETSIPWELD